MMQWSMFMFICFFLPNCLSMRLCYGRPLQNLWTYGTVFEQGSDQCGLGLYPSTAKFLVAPGIRTLMPSSSGAAMTWQPSLDLQATLLDSMLSSAHLQNAMCCSDGCC